MPDNFAPAHWALRQCVKTHVPKWYQPNAMLWRTQPSGFICTLHPSYLCRTGFKSQAHHLCIFLRNLPKWFIFLNGPTPVSFLSFQTNNTILTTVKKCSSSIRRWDSNPRPLEHESSPIRLDQGSRPKMIYLMDTAICLFNMSLKRLSDV